MTGQHASIRLIRGARTLRVLANASGIVGITAAALLLLDGELALSLLALVLTFGSSATLVACSMLLGWAADRGAPAPDDGHAAGNRSER